MGQALLNADFATMLFDSPEARGLLANRHRRTPCVLLLDTSSGHQGQRQAQHQRYSCAAQCRQPGGGQCLLQQPLPLGSRRALPVTAMLHQPHGQP